MCPASHAPVLKQVGTWKAQGARAANDGPRIFVNLSSSGRRLPGRPRMATLRTRASPHEGEQECNPSTTSCASRGMPERFSGRSRMSTNEARRGVEALKQFRLATADICDVTPLTQDDDFEVSSQVFPIALGAGSALLVHSDATGLRYDRTPSHIARGGLDHYQVTLCAEGEMEFSSGRRKLALRPGDLCLIDMAQPNRTTLTEGAARRCQVRTLILPRALLAPQLAFPDAATATLLSRADQPSQVLREQFTALWQAGVSGDSDAAAALSTMMDIIATIVGSAAQVEKTVERADRPLFLAMIKRYIDAQLETEMLGAEQLCRRFGVSRASLYRMFVPEGGLAHYVQEQRLNIAMRRLVSSAEQTCRLIDLAVDLQFSSDSTFVRAFRRKFGLTPGEIREKSQAWQRDGRAPPASDDILHNLSKH